MGWDNRSSPPECAFDAVNRALGEPSVESRGLSDQLARPFKDLLGRRTNPQSPVGRLFLESRRQVM